MTQPAEGVVASIEELKRLAKEATNGWACFAKQKREHDEIARLHREIDLCANRLLALLPSVVAPLEGSAGGTRETALGSVSQSTGFTASVVAPSQLAKIPRYRVKLDVSEGDPVALMEASESGHWLKLSDVAELAIGVVAPSQEPQHCTWTEDGDEYDSEKWDTNYGEAFVFIDGTPLQNHLKFCCYCGKPVKEQRAVAASPDPGKDS